MSVSTRIWIASLTWLLCPVAGQAQHWSFQMYGTDQGLTNPTMLSLQQDREGFLWASTEGGLFRYDGDRFRPFSVNSAGRKGNSTSMHSSADGQFWTVSSAGLFRWTGDAFVAVPGFEDVDLSSCRRSVAMLQTYTWPRRRASARCPSRTAGNLVSFHRSRPVVYWWHPIKQSGLVAGFCSAHSKTAVNRSAPATTA